VKEVALQQEKQPIDWVRDLTLHADALLSAMQNDKELFAPLIHYVKELARALRRPTTEVKKSLFVVSAEKIRAFYSDYSNANSSPGFLYIPPGEIASTRTTADDICGLIAKLTALPDDQFAACLRPPITQQYSGRKPPPEHIAQICRNGHLVLSSLHDFPQFRKTFCEDCGAATIEQCQTCSWPITGLGPHSWMGGGGAYKPPRYCGECGKPFPWTETALEAAREYADDLDQLSSEEKAKLKATFDDLTIDTIRTPLAANRFKKFMTKVGPAAGGVLQKILEAVATEAAKKSMGL
jgi:hypothetical protein